MREHRKNILATFVLGALFLFLLLEIFCQAYFHWVMVEPWEATKRNEAHYFRTSNDPVLTYDLLPGFHLVKDEKTVTINKYGIREREDEISQLPRVAVLGDSVTFGIGQSQDETISASLQEKLGADFKVLNLGVPGYSISEIFQFLKTKNSVYHLNHIIYLLNLNDFAKRDSVYEGADNGLYRMYRHPTFKSPLFIRKAIYRFYKEGKMSSVAWYRWFFKGNKARGLGIIEEMSRYAKEHNSDFSVVMFPPGVGYQENGYALDDVFSEIITFLEANNIAYIDTIKAFQEDVATYIDHTDHLTPVGSDKMAEIIWQGLKIKSPE